MTQQLTETDARQAKPANRLRYILSISISLTICALIGVAYIYV